jgi:hypothetical protein
MHAITALVSDGHRVGVCVRRNHAASARLEAVEFEHTVLTTPPASPLGSTAERVLGAVRLGRYTRAFAPSVIVGESTPAVRAASRLTGARLVSWDEPTAVDGDIVSPALYGAAARYHPEWFSPDEAVRERHGVDEPGEYTIALFTAKASPYNAPEGGLSRRTKGKLVETLSTVGRVYVDNVDDPHPALAASRITVPPRETPHLPRGLRRWWSPTRRRSPLGARSVKPQPSTRMSARAIQFPSRSPNSPHGISFVLPSGTARHSRPSKNWRPHPTVRRAGNSGLRAFL